MRERHHEAVTWELVQVETPKNTRILDKIVAVLALRKEKTKP